MACITLLSDLGLQDASVAIAKGILLQHCPSANLYDISHEIMPFHREQATYIFASAYKNFPPGTIHVLLFNLFSDVTPKLILSAKDGHYFLSPDNGIVPSLPGNDISSWLCAGLAPESTFSDWIHEAGRVITQLQHASPEAMALPSFTSKHHTLSSAMVSDAGGVACDVIHIDRFGNAVLNITRQQFGSWQNNRMFRLQFMQVEEVSEISNSYNSVREGYKLCRFNSNGYLEICINRGRAASLFGLRLGSRHNDIKLFFE